MDGVEGYVILSNIIKDNTKTTLSLDEDVTDLQDLEPIGCQKVYYEDGSRLGLGFGTTATSVPVVTGAGQESTDSNTSSVVPDSGDTHVVYGCDTLTTTRSRVKKFKKKTSVDTDT